jgi:hypothetical protein
MGHDQGFAGGPQQFDSSGIMLKETALLKFDVVGYALLNLLFRLR